MSQTNLMNVCILLFVFHVLINILRNICQHFFLNIVVNLQAVWDPKLTVIRTICNAALIQKLLN